MKIAKESRDKMVPLRPQICEIAKNQAISLVLSGLKFVKTAKNGVISSVTSSVGQSKFYLNLVLAKMFVHGITRTRFTLPL